MGFVDFNTYPGANSTPGATDFDTMMRQSTMRFADSAARDAALSGVLAEGMRAYTDDADTFWFYDGSAWVIESEPVRAWTPTVTQGSTVTKTVNWSGYQRANDGYRAFCKLTMTGSGTPGNSIIVSTPFTHIEAFGAFGFFDDSLGLYRAGFVLPESMTEYSFIIDLGALPFGNAASDGLTSGDQLWLSVQGTY